MQAAKQSRVSKSEIARVAVKLFFGITEKWDLTDEQCCVLAGLSSRATLTRWRDNLDAHKPIRLGKDTLERLSYIAGIYSALQTLFSMQPHSQEWIHKPNEDFGGQSALQRMLRGNVVDLADIRRYLDSWLEV